MYFGGLMYFLLLLAILFFLRIRPWVLEIFHESQPIVTPVHYLSHPNYKVLYQKVESCFKCTLNHVFSSTDVPLFNSHDKILGLSMDDVHNIVRQRFPGRRIDMNRAPSLEDIRRVVSYATCTDHYVLGNYNRLPIWWSNAPFFIKIYQNRGHWSCLLEYQVKNDYVLIHEKSYPF